ncbi:hypothetical protein MJO29_013641 [Puccinia striiformis f. sp. tritici]|nr:hypothetical protein MJO29_013641 [Puccinia striiformis f. sp. tritici]
MVDMGKITTKAPGKDGHILAPNLANFFAPPKVAYTRLKSTLEQSWSTLHFSDVKNQWVQQAFDDKNGVYSAYAHFCQSYENLGTTPSAPNTDDVSRSAMDLVQTFCGVMAGLAYICTKSNMRPKQAKLDRARTTHHTEHVQMLANLLIFGPTAAFTSLRKKAGPWNQCPYATLNLRQSSATFSELPGANGLHPIGQRWCPECGLETGS